GGTTQWVWMSCTRGLNPIYMDPYYANTPFCFPPDPAMRSNLGYARDFVLRMNLAMAVPHSELATTTYCLADPGYADLVFAPNGGNFSVTLTAAPGPLKIDWLNISTGALSAPISIPGGSTLQFSPPFSGSAAAFIHRPLGDTNATGHVDIDDLLAV